MKHWPTAILWQSQVQCDQYSVYLFGCMVLTSSWWSNQNTAPTSSNCLLLHTLLIYVTCILLAKTSWKCYRWPFCHIGTLSLGQLSINQVNQGWEPDSPCSTSASSFSRMKLGVCKVLIHTHRKYNNPKTEAFHKTDFCISQIFLRKIWEMYSSLQ